MLGLSESSHQPHRPLALKILLVLVTWCSIGASLYGLFWHGKRYFDLRLLLRTASAPLPQEPSRPADALPRLTQEGVLFRYYAPQAKAVLLGGSFNEWRADMHKLSKMPEGFWDIIVPLAPGEYHYKFKVDGEWVLDPNNPATSQDTSASFIRVP